MLGTGTTRSLREWQAMCHTPTKANALFSASTAAFLSMEPVVTSPPLLPPIHYPRVLDDYAWRFSLLDRTGIAILLIDLAPLTCTKHVLSKTVPFEPSTIKPRWPMLQPESFLFPPDCLSSTRPAAELPGLDRRPSSALTPPYYVHMHAEGNCLRSCNTPWVRILILPFLSECENRPKRCRLDEENCPNPF